MLDDRSSGTLVSNIGTRWRLITDGVMGGISSGRLSLTEVDGRRCLRLHGEVSTANNGGFIQLQLPLAPTGEFDAGDYNGVRLVARGNGERYNLHLKTVDLSLPWQSYRVEFLAGTHWQTFDLPFARFAPHRTTRALDPRGLERLGVVAIGRPFTADLCVAEVGLY